MIGALTTFKATLAGTFTTLITALTGAFTTFITGRALEELILHRPLEQSPTNVDSPALAVTPSIDTITNIIK